MQAVEAELALMRQQADEAQTLRQRPPVPPVQAEASLQSATARLGAGARLSRQGDRAVLTFQGVSGEALAAWLEEVRVGARGAAAGGELAARRRRALPGLGHLVFGCRRGAVSTFQTTVQGTFQLLRLRWARRPRWLLGPEAYVTRSFESTLEVLRWDKVRKAGQRWAWAGAVLGGVAGLVAFAPASWLAHGVSRFEWRAPAAGRCPRHDLARPGGGRAHRRAGQPGHARPAGSLELDLALAGPRRARGAAA